MKMTANLIFPQQDSLGVLLPVSRWVLSPEILPISIRPADWPYQGDAPFFDIQGVLPLISRLQQTSELQIHRKTRNRVSAMPKV
jgi:hypothetical protein